MKRYGIIAAIIAATVGLALFGYDYMPRDCSKNLPVYDSRDVINSEKTETLAGAKAYFQTFQKSLSKVDVLPAPLSVSISGRDATLRVSGPHPGNDYNYVGAWYRVFSSHHSDNRCVVRMRISWRTGHLDQFSPISFI